MKSSHQRVGSEPIPGYVLRKRLGAGGYGEVWLADAPGGLQKAVKLVFGSADQNLARTELRSLERIKEVNHPFLLSLERIEIVDDQLIIITELADESLHLRFRWHRRQGTPGIPRGKLLEYLHDAAVGLDFLENRHSLQHLDVKPGNLLLLADRVKVADFGLVKDLSCKSQSLIRGLTPSYSAPEIFDGKPNARSDQYSLAIVYMEMLSGNHPFRGRTTGELARQHLTQQPNLESLPPADRIPVARALAKNPSDRFSNCRQFVEQLQKIRTSSIARLPDSMHRAADSTGGQAGSSISTPTSTQQKSSTQNALPSDPKFLKALPLGEIQLEAPFSTPHSMFISLGGVGANVLRKLRQLTLSNCDSNLSVDEHRWLAVDTVPLKADHRDDLLEDVELPSDCVVQLPIYRPVDYRNCDPNLLAPISRRWLYNIPRSQRTEGVRPLGTLALLDHYRALRSRIHSDLVELVRANQKQTTGENPLQIYVTCSLHGGTGSALLPEVGFMIRKIMIELGCGNYRLTAVATLANCAGMGEVSLPAAAALASLSELHHLMESAEDIPSIYPSELLTGSLKPFDWITLVDGGLIQCSEDAQMAAADAADFMLVDSQTSVGHSLTEVRLSETNSQLGWLRTGVAVPLRLNDDIDPAAISRLCVRQVVEDYRRKLDVDHKLTPDKAPSEHSHEIRPRPGPGPGHRQPHTPTISHAVELMITELALIESNERKDDEVTVDAAIIRWGKRVGLESTDVTSQIAADVESWQRSILMLLKTETCHWQEVDAIQQEAIQHIVDLDSKWISQVASKLSKLLVEGRRFKELCKRIQDYREMLVKSLTNWHRHFQQQQERLVATLECWPSLLCSADEQDNSCDSTLLSGMPAEIQTLASRTTEHAALWMEDKIIDCLRVEPNSPSYACLDDSETLNPEQQLQAFLAATAEFLERAAEENDVQLCCSSSANNRHSERAVAAPQLRQQVPAMARFGGEFHRLTVAPSEQFDAMKSLLEDDQLLEKTTLLPCSPSLASYLVFEGKQPSVSLMVSHYCLPTPQTLQLAERLHTRVDVEWPVVSELLEAVQPLEADMNLGGKPATTPMTANHESLGFEGLASDQFFNTAEGAGN